MPEISEAALQFVEGLEDPVTAIEHRLKLWEEEGVDSIGIAPIGEAIEILSDFLNRLDAVSGELQRIVAQALPDGSLVPLGTGNILERSKTQPSKKWQHKPLMFVVSEKILEKAIDPETGAIETPTSVLIRQMLDYCQPQYWRITKLRELGISPENYYETGDSHAKVQIIQSAAYRRP